MAFKIRLFSRYNVPTMNKPDVKKPMKAVSNNATSNKPSREKAMDAVRTLIEWAGDDPTREGLN